MMARFHAFLQSFVAVRSDERGQTMAEYAIVLAVIVVAVVATLVLLAGGINSTLSNVTSSL
jgi:Flp pilus assembly pilin Flp